MEQFKLSSTGYAFTFQAMANIPQKYLVTASILSEVGYSIPTILPIGDNAPNDIPIILLRRDGDSSQISICRNKCTVIFPNNITDADQKDAIDKLLEFLKKFSGSLSSLHYFGINKIFQLTCKDSIARISDKVSFLSDFTDVSDINISFSEIIQNRFYANTHIANNRIYNTPINPNEKGFLTTPFKLSLIVNLDVNNRYAFNMGHDISDFMTELSSIKEILNEKESQILTLFN